MPDHFSPEDKRLIRSRLLEHAAALFAAKGAKAVKVADIVKAAGIAKGSFYAFFPSKEALLAEILDSIERSEREALLYSLAALESPTPEAVGTLILASLRRASAHPLLMAVFKDEAFNAVFRSLPEESKDHLVSADVAFAAQVIGLLGDRGLLAAVSPEVAAGLFKCLFLAISAPDEIGRAAYAETVDRLSAAVARTVFPGRPE